MIDLTRCHRPLMNCISEAAAALVGAGVSAAGSAASITMGGKMNQRAQHEAWRTRQWQTAEREASQAWQLEQWNRQNAYNSPAEQLKRAKEAGINPLAVINGDFRPSEAGMPSGAQAPGGAQAQFHNPMDGSNIDGAMNKVLEFKQLELAKKKTDADIRRMDYQNAKDFADTMTENLMRNKSYELADANVKLILSNEKLSTQELQNKMQDFLMSKQKLQESVAQVEYIKGQTALNEIRKLVERQKWDKEEKILAQQFLNMVTQRSGMREDNITKYYNREMTRHELEEYYENGEVNRNTYYGRNLARQDDMQDLQHRNLINNVKDPYSATVDKALDTMQGIANVVSTFANASSAIANRGVSLRSNANPQPSFNGFSHVQRGPQPSWNPAGQGGNAPFW